MTTLSMPDQSSGPGNPTGKENSTPSPHFVKGKFRNDKPVLDMSPGSWISSAWRFVFEKNNQVPDIPLPVEPMAKIAPAPADELLTTWLGHSSLLIRANGYTLLTDPVFKDKVSPIGPTRFTKSPVAHPERFADIDAVIISHDHYDHLNRQAMTLLEPVTKHFLVPLGVGRHLKNWGIPDGKITELDWWESLQIDENLTLTATPAQHFSGRGIRDRNRTLWASWVIRTADFNLFFGGDSGYFNGFKEIGDALGPFDMTFIECGAYDEQWKKVHLFPEETVMAHMDLQGTLLHPIHWGTFNLSHHAWYDPMQRLTAAAEKADIRVATPVAGQSIRFNGKNLGSAWWQTALDGGRNPSDVR